MTHPVTTTPYHAAMVLAYHLVLTAYGFWLPNDPRGSYSDFVRSFDLYQAAGKATKVSTRRSVAHHAHDPIARERAKQALARKPVVFTGQQARTVALGFADYCTSNSRPCLACAVMPDHAHLVLQRTDLPIEKQAEQLKARATAFLNKAQLHPFQDHPLPNGRTPTPWARKHWSVFLRDDASILRAIQYVEQNPIKAGYKPQHYDWVTPFSA
ncbi:MAG: transposase [Phycisphaerales bacterium JB063]